MEMTSIPLTLITPVMQSLLDDGEDCSIQRAYSGRGMYGATCLAVDFRSHAALNRFFFELGLAVARDQSGNDFLEEELAELVDSVRTDQLGLGIVAYFPGFVLG